LLELWGRIELLQVQLKSVLDIGDFFDLSFHLFGESIEFLDFVLDFNGFDLLYALSHIFGEKGILFLFFILIIFGL
jgi:hypothetical protein